MQDAAKECDIEKVDKLLEEYKYDNLDKLKTAIKNGKKEYNKKKL